MSDVFFPNAFQPSMPATTVLIVEDSECDRVAYRRYLQSGTNANYQILTAENLEKGLELWQKQRPELVILDPYLSDGCGLKLLEAIGETYPEQKLPVVVITQQGSELLALEALKMGASDYLVKEEMTATALCRAVTNVNSQWTLSQKLARSQQQNTILSQISLHIRQFLNLKDICQAIVTDVRTFLQCDRVVIYKFNPDLSGAIIAESVIDPYQPCLGKQIIDTCFQENQGAFYQQGKIFAISDIYTANLTDCHRQMLESFQVRANLVVPILVPTAFDQSPSVWGLLIVHQCSGPRLWKDSNIELLQRLSVQLAIAIQQAELYQQSQMLNADLERKVAERTYELQSLLEQYRQVETNLKFQARILDEIYDAVISTDLNGIIHTWNYGAESLLGYQAEEIIGQNVEILCQNVSQVQPEMIELLLIAGEYELETIVRAKSGEHREISLRISIFFDEQGNILRLLACANDISDRKAAEEKLRKTTDRLTIALKSGAIGSWEWNLVKNTGLWDERMYELYGIDQKSNSLSECEILANAIHPDDRNRVQTLLHKAILGEAEYNTEFRIVHSDGSIHFIKCYGDVVRDHQGNPQRMIGVNFDISDRREAEAEVQEFNRRWQSVRDNIQMIVLELDQEGIVQYINPFFQKISQFDPEEVIGKHWITRFVPQDLVLSIETVYQELLVENANEYYINPIVAKSGEELMIAWRSYVLQNQEGESIGVIALGEDITEQHRLERTKSEFLSIVSHELKTPLTTIQASLSLLNEKFIDPASQEGATTIEIATDGIDRLVRLVNDIFDVERLESGKFYLKKSDCNTQKIMADAIAQVQEFAKQAEIKIQVAPSSFPLYADADRLVQVLINLLSNAIKFSPNASTIDLSVEKQTPEFLDQLNAPTYLLFTVRDRGRGIAPQNLETIFERFKQVDSSDARDKGGTGLGLAISREIVKQHGGKIWAESLLGQGSTFYFTVDYCKNR